MHIIEYFIYLNPAWRWVPRMPLTFFMQSLRLPEPRRALYASRICDADALSPASPLMEYLLAVVVSHA